MMFNQYLRYALYFGIFAVPFIPLIVSSTMFFPFITGKNFTFRIIVELILGGWIILALRLPAQAGDSAYRPKFSWLLAAVASFIGIMTLATIFSEDPFKSFWSNYERMEGLVTLFHLFAYFLVAGAMLNSEKLWNWLFNTSIFVSGILGIYGLVQLAGKAEIHQGGTRLDATLGNATYLAIYMLFHAFLTAIMLVRWRGGSWWIRSAYILLLALQVFTLYHTATRGAILGFIGGALLATILVVLLEREQRVLKKVAIGTLIGIAILVGGFLVAKDSSFVRESPVLSRISSISFEGDSATRFKIWNMAWQGFKERPLLGWGQENFNFVFNKYYNPVLHDQEPWFDRVHNIVFDWLIAGGILGFLAYVAIPLTALFYLWRSSTQLTVVEKSLFTGMLAGYGFHNLFVFDNIVSYIMFFTILAYLHHANSRPFSEKIARMFSFSRETREYAIPIIVVALVAVSLYAVNIKGILAARTLIQALGAQEEGLEENLALFKKALAYNAFGRQEIVEQLTSVATQIQQMDVEPDIKAVFFEMTKSEVDALIADNPGDARLYLLGGSFLNRAGRYDKAIAYLEKATETTPNKQAVYFELGSAYLNKGDTGQTFKVFEYAHQLDPTYQEARFIYAIGAIYAGQENVANEIIDTMFEQYDAGTGGLVVDQRVLQAYARTGQLNKIISILERVIERNPDNLDYFKTLAATYGQAGQHTQAIDVLNRAIEAHPGFKGEGEQYIRQIQSGNI